MEVYDESDKNIVKESIHADLICSNCDTPGARKASGLAGHSHDLHSCAWCRCTLLDVNKPTGYIAESESFVVLFLIISKRQFRLSGA